jgi:hypothetical protein
MSSKRPAVSTARTMASTGYSKLKYSSGARRVDHKYETAPVVNTAFTTTDCKILLLKNEPQKLLVVFESDCSKQHTQGNHKVGCR